MNQLAKQTPMTPPIKTVNANGNHGIAQFMKSAKKDARLLRGELIDYFCQIENLLARILQLLSCETAYQAILKNIQPQLSGYVGAFHKICHLEGKFKAQLKQMISIANETAKYLELRNMMAHAKMTIFIDEELHIIYSFEIIKFESLPPNICRTIHTHDDLVINIASIQSLIKRLEVNATKICNA